VKVAKVIAVLIVGPLFGAVTGLVLGIIAMPSQAPSGRSPGDGILILGCVCVCAFVSFLVSALLAWKLWFRSGAG
jgi:hypothetical protein